MITGFVTGKLEARLGLTILGSAGQSHQTEAIIDTAFDGFLALPPALIASLGIPFLFTTFGVVADGSQHRHDVFRGTILWDGQPRTIEIEAIDTQPLIGVRLLRRMELRIEFVSAGAVTITPLP